MNTPARLVAKICIAEALSMTAFSAFVTLLPQVDGDEAMALSLVMKVTKCA